MRTAFSSLFRLLSIVAAVLVVVAILIGRAVPEMPEVRRIDPDRPMAISRNLTRTRQWVARFYDPKTGHQGRIELPDGETLDYASFSPWRDRGGRHQVVGLWAKYARAAASYVLIDASLVRMSFPEGRILDRVIPEVNPIGPPCWYPGTAARVLYAGADGRLYQYDFEAPSDGILGQRGPRPLSWEVRGVAESDILLSDPCWPIAARFADTILVSLRRVTSTAAGAVPPAELWWLRLDPGGGTILAGGRLTAPPDGDTPDDSEFSPTVVTNPDGGALLAYLALRDRDSTWRLHVAPLRFDRRDGTPRVGATAGRLVGRGTRPDPPAFSPDGRWVSCVVPPRDEQPAAPVRLAVADFGVEPRPAKPQGGSLAALVP